MQNPLRLLFRATSLLLAGRLRVHPGLGDLRLEHAGESFRAFRKVSVRPSAGSPGRAGAVLQVRFRFRNLPGWTNRLLSLIPVPFIVAQPGFRSKTWTIGETTGDFFGLYEFDTESDAEAYRGSLPLRMMRRRAVPGSLAESVEAAASSAAAMVERWIP